jgi:hypothetical protein
VRRWDRWLLVTDPSSLLISIDRTSLSLSPLVLAGHDVTRALSVSDYQEPAMQPRIQYAPSSDDVSGEMPLGWVWQDSILGFSVFAEDADTESDLRGRIAELTAAVARLSYETTVTVNDADPEVWSCRPGSVTPVGGRTSADLQDHTSVWSVAIPVYPIRSV